MRVAQKMIRIVALCLGAVTCGGATAPLPPALESALQQRYAPGVNWRSFLDLSVLEAVEAEPYWRGLDRLRADRPDGALPLAGWHVALDAGHIGGVWAASEGREFRLSADDFWVREGELVLEVAQRIRSQLQALGAKVSLLREDYQPINPRGAWEYLIQAQAEVPAPRESSFAALWKYGKSLQQRATQLAVVRGEIQARAQRVNLELQPDFLLSLHINAAPWPRSEAGVELLQLVQSNHLHVLVPGCFSAQELQEPGQWPALATKLVQGSGVEELQLAKALAHALKAATALPAASYRGHNAIQLEAGNPYVWARNLLLLRQVECPVLLLEPYVANSAAVYPRIQTALAARAAGEPLAPDDILIEYADAVVAGLLAAASGAVY